jgi:hypothetical protein
MGDEQSSTRRRVLRVGAVAAVTSVAGCVEGAQSLRDLNSEDAPPVYADGDPSRNSYPRNPDSAEEELLGSRGIQRAFELLYTEYRERNGAEELYPNGSLSSGARKHSYDMATHGYVAPAGPNGEDPVEKYEPLQVSCTAVESLVHSTPVTVVDGEGERTGVTDADVARDIFSVFRDDAAASDALLLPKREAASAGVGVYLAPQDGDGTEEVVDVYLTVDVCRGFDAGKPAVEY